MASYYIANDNQRTGPFPEEQLLQNGLTPNSLVWCNGMAGWQKASEVPELARYFAPQEPQYAQPQYAQPQYGQPQYGQPQYGQPQYGQPQYEQPQYGSQYNQPQYAQGQYQGYGDIPPRPHNFLWWAILSTIFCAWPFGIPAIINAAKVNPAYNRGDYDQAQSHAKSARTWSLVSTLVGVGIITIYIIILAAA